MRLRSQNWGDLFKYEGTSKLNLQPPSSVDVPTATKRPVVQGRRRLRACTVDNREDMDFKTPVRAKMRNLKMFSGNGPSSPCNSTVRNIYSPIVRFLTPTKENLRTPGRGDVVMSPEPCVFGYSSIGLPTGDEDNDVFSPLTFVKSIPSRSQSKHCLRDIPPKTRSTPQVTLVLDLDETLVFTSLNGIGDAEYKFFTSFQDHQYKVDMMLRPYLEDFLQSMAKVYEMFVYTSAKKEFAEKILDILDPKRKLFRHRLYQEDCTCVLGHYVKDLELLERDLAKTVVLDNAPHTYPYHFVNVIPIKSWSGDKDDKELQKLIPYLERLSDAKDFRDVLEKRTDHFHRLLSEN